MKVFLFVVFYVYMIAAYGQAFDTLAVSKPPISNTPGYEYPRVDNDSRAIFRVLALRSN